KGCGMRLKLEQRKLAIKQGIRLAQWTFDPLQGLNAHFNIEKLGVIAREYFPNLYGHSTSTLNRGIETDRFLADWWLRSSRVKRHLAGKSSSVPVSGILAEHVGNLVNTTEPVSYSMRVCKKVHAPWNQKRLFVEIPENIQAMKAENTELAVDWREKTRHIFQQCFKRGYVVTGFSSQRIEEARRTFYILDKAPSGITK
ncbi:MAG: hypothetical protein RDV41_13665, partial [Planctomycetota bacterium]|nr:hypothetical protein [Planctomycetota bacterium]